MLRWGLATTVATLMAMGLGGPTVRLQAQQAASETVERGDGVLPLGETEAVDGVLPLRMPSDGVLPLRLNGEANTMTPNSVATHLPTQIVITQALQMPMSAPQAAALVCQQPESQVSKHVATGTVGFAGALYVIKGICYNHSNSNMEVVAERTLGGNAVEQSSLVGVLPSEHPAQFAGRLVVNGSSDRAGRYSFDTHAATLVQP
jgi:hypothetical protein